MSDERQAEAASGAGEAPPQPIAGHGVCFADIAVAASALLAEGLLVALAVLSAAPIALLVAGHLFVVAVLLLWLHRLHVGARTDTTAPLLLVVATFATGPFGSLGLLVLLPFLARRPRPSALLAAWYDRIALSTDIDPAERLANVVAARRSIDAAAPAPVSFEMLMQRGTLHERQSALGLIARKFHPEYAPALKVALLSPEPVVRVQAAAVAARLRGELKRKLAGALQRAGEAGGDAARARRLAAEIDGLLLSGLLDESDSRRARAGLEELRAARLAATARVPAQRAADDVHGLESALIASGRFAELRARRKARRLSRAGLFRVRLPAAGRTAREPSP